MLWTLLAALAQPPTDALDAWRQRAAEKSSTPPVQGAGDIDGDGLDEHWLILGCEGVLFVDEDRWLWVFGDGGDPRPAPSASTLPHVHCGILGYDSEDTYGLDDGVPYLRTHRHAGRHGAYGESHRAERWTRGEWQHKAVWAYDTSPLQLGGRTVTVERADDGAILRGLGPKLTLPALHTDGPAAQLQWVDGGVEVVLHDEPPPISPGHDGLYLHDTAILQIEGAKLVVDPSPLPPPPPHVVGSVTEPPGPCERPRAPTPRPGRRRSPALDEQVEQRLAGDQDESAALLESRA